MSPTQQSKTQPDVRKTFKSDLCVLDAIVRVGSGHRYNAKEIFLDTTDLLRLTRGYGNMVKSNIEMFRLRAYLKNKKQSWTKSLSEALLQNDRESRSGDGASSSGEPETPRLQDSNMR